VITDEPADPLNIDLGDLWRRVRAHLNPIDDQALGVVRVGITDADTKPWAQTNDGEDKVNLTLETKPDQLELNLVGWKEVQSEALKDWLQSVRGENVVNGLDGYEVVAFARRAYKKTPTSKPWWQDETILELGKCPAPEYNTGWAVRTKVGMKNPKEEKPAFHLRRTWSLRQAEQLGDELPEAIAVEVRTLIPILREIWSRPAPS
jgi:hypothetical protein